MMTRIFTAAAVAVLLIGSIPSRLAAQTGALGLVFCRKVTDESARLKCYDAIMESIFDSKSVKEKEPPSEPKMWRITEQNSPIDDSPEMTATLISTSGSSALIIRCKEKKTELIFAPEDYLGTPMSSTIKVVIRINDAPAVSESWSASSTGRGSFSPNPVQTIKIIPDSARVFLRAFDFQGVPHDANFDIGEFSIIRDKIKQTCKWPDPKPTIKTSTPATSPQNKP